MTAADAMHYKPIITNAVRHNTLPFMTHFVKPFVAIFFVTAIVFASCKKNANDMVANAAEQTTTTANKGDASGAFDFSIPTVASVEERGNSTPNTTLAFSGDIVTGTGYRHFSQRNSSSCSGSICLPTAYMLARGIKYSTRTVSNTELQTIGRAIGVITTSGCAAGYITNGSTYARSNIGSCNAANVAFQGIADNTYSADAGRTQAKDYIRACISNRLPVIALIRVSGSQTDGAGVVSTSGTGHFVVVVGLTETATGTGSVVRYIDPLKTSAGVKSADYSLFLNSMKNASSSWKYNLLRIGC